MAIIILLSIQILSVALAGILHFKREYDLSNFFAFVGIALCFVILFLN